MAEPSPSASTGQTKAGVAAVRRRKAAIERHLVIVHQPGWQAVEDWIAISQLVRKVDSSIGVIVVGADRANESLRHQAAERPSLIFSAGPLGGFVPLRGKVYNGRVIPKMEQLRRLAAAGVPVPATTVLRPGQTLDPKRWGRFVVLKPTDIGSSSHGQGIQLVRAERVVYRSPKDYPPDHPGRKGPMLVQQFVDTGPHIEGFRVLTLFGEPLYCEYSYSVADRVDLASPDEVIESAVIALQGDTEQRRRELVYKADVVSLARAAHRAIPEIPLKGCDIIRDARTGRMYVLELNPGGNTWHFSSSFLAEFRSKTEDYNLRRLAQLDAFGTTAQVLAQVTREEAI